MTNVTLRPAREEERPIVERLMQLYAHDWSEMVELDVDDEGRFAGVSLEAYWVDAWRHPFLLRVGDKLAGFALIVNRSRLTGASDVFDMAELFVMRRYRRQGVGLTAALAAFDRFKGKWEVRQRDENPNATAFWRRAIAVCSKGEYKETRWESVEWTGTVHAFANG